ncbi:MAG: glycosyltransferase [Thermodesulfobacteriota bacterium]
MKNLRVVFLHSIVPYNTSYYYFKALKSLNVELIDVPFDPHKPQPDKPLPEGDLLLLIDCGLPVCFPSLKKYNCPKGFVSIDSCHKLEIHRDYCDENEFDYIWVAQKHIAEGLGPRASWLPLAADEEEHVFRPELAKGEGFWECCLKKSHYDIGMCGAPYKHRRQFEKLFRKNGLSTNFYFRKKFRKSATREIGRCTIGFNVGAGFTGEKGKDINMRVFETMANGQAMLLTNTYENVGYEDLFLENRHYVTYKTEDEAVEKARYFANNPLEAARIAREGQRHILANHTYLHRCKEILSVLERSE